MDIVFASKNPHKLIEVNQIMGGQHINFLAPEDSFNPIENGSDFEENSYIKALEASRIAVSGNYFLADDSGLCIDYLKGAPGLKSARYEATPEKRIQRVLKELLNVPKDQRSAYFICVLVLCNKKGEILHTSKGICKGSIAFEAKGKEGFGYDPIFEVEGFKGRTMAELTSDEKNKISHRALAFQDMKEYLKTL